MDGPGAAAASATPQLATVDETLLEALPVRRRDDLRALLGATVVSVPLTVRAMTFGALTVLRPDGSAFTGDEVRFLAELGHRAALTLDNARLYESERFVALELQRSLLPARLPASPSSTSPAGTSPAPPAPRSAATGTTSSRCAADGWPWRSAT